MSTSDRQEQGPLTRKQLREIRLTGSTPVITAEEAAAAAAASEVPPAAPDDVDTHEDTAARDESTVTTEDAADAEASGAEASDAEPAASETPAAPSGFAGDAAANPVGLTRRQVRELERLRAGSASAPDADADDADDADDAVPVPAPVSATGVADETPATASPAAQNDDTDQDDTDHDDTHHDDAVHAAGAEFDAEADRDEEAADTDDVLADVAETETEDISAEANPTVNPAFGQELLTDPSEARAPFAPSFDELLTVSDSTGSQHLAPNTLIFNPSPGDGSLSGPVASTGEILVTGSYELPRGLGSQGHAHGTTDGKDVDAVLIDGELPPASSPTPIAASAAVSTIKPAGEVIRPPAPEKGNKLMLILAIVAGGLALALGVSLIVAFTTNVF